MLTGRPMDGRTDRRTDKDSYRVACPQLKIVLIDDFFAISTMRLIIVMGPKTNDIERYVPTIIQDATIFLM